MKQYEIHPAAALFPMLGEEKLTALQNDIMVEGQLEPIILRKISIGRQPW